MALVTRLSRLFTADLHAVLDRIEEPEALLRQAIREMEEELARSQQRIKWLRSEQDQLVSRERQITEKLPELEEQLDVCFDSGEEALARKLIRRKLEAERLLKKIAGKREALAKNLVEQQSNLDEDRARLESMRQKADVLLEESEAKAEGQTAQDWTVDDCSVGDDEVEVAFLREKQRRARS